MELTELQLEIQKLWADKTLSYGCIVKSKTDQSIYEYNTYFPEDIIIRVDEYQVFTINDLLDWDVIRTIEEFDDIYKTIWHPITRWRLCYINSKIKTSPEKRKMRDEITYNFKLNPELYNKSILERPEELQLLVRDFLLSIQ